MPSDVARLLLNCPDLDTARTIAAALLDAELIACANIYPPIESHYVWQGERVSEPEIPLVMKTRSAHIPAIEAQVDKLHPYDVPPLVAQTLDYTTQGYGDWVAEVTKQP